MFPRHPCATDTHMDRREKKIPSDSTTETKWRLWEPSYVYSIGLLYFSSHCFEDCFNVHGGFNVVLPSRHYFPVCHAEDRWEIKKWELQRVTVDRWGTQAYVQAAGISCPVEYTRYKKGLFWDFYTRGRDCSSQLTSVLPEYTQQCASAAVTCLQY